MARWRASFIYVGIKHHVVAFDRKTGVEAWRTVLPARYKSTNTPVNVYCDAEGLFASCAGEIFALAQRSGAILWNNPMKGMGTGIAIFASPRGDSAQGAALAAANSARQAAAASAAAV